MRSVTSFAQKQGGTLSFTNEMQEQPIQEIWAYDVGAGKEPEGSFKLSYAVDSRLSPRIAPLASLNDFIAGRYPANERSTVLAMPAGGVKAAVGAGSAGGGGPMRCPLTPTPSFIS